MCDTSTMEGIHPNWKSLPVEILHEIFQIAAESDTTEVARNFISVCKAWAVPAQVVLYSRVHVDNISRLEKFHCTVENNNQLGSKVKIFELRIDVGHEPAQLAHHIEFKKIYSLLTKLLSTCLPNLEELQEHSIHTYTPVLNALEDFHLTRLQRLNIPNNSVTESELANYATCALLLRDRIEEIAIMEDKEAADVTSNYHLHAGRLYKKMHQFNNLKSLILHKKIKEEIHVMEHILATCRHLNNLEVNFYSSHDVSQPRNNSVFIDTISSFHPIDNILSLNCFISPSRDYKMLTYIMHKFPQLQHLTLRTDENSDARLNHHMLAPLLKYATELDSFSVSTLRIDKNIVLDAIMDCWKQVSGPGAECLKFFYSSDSMRIGTCLLSISHDSNQYTTTFQYPVDTNTEEQYADFIEKSGTFVKKLKIMFNKDDLVRCQVHDNFLGHIFTYCPNIQSLYVDTCVLKRSTHYSMIDYRLKLSLDLLQFNCCVLYPGMLEHVSPLLTSIKELRISGFKLHFREDYPLEAGITGNDPDFEIIMSHTKIHRIIITELDSREVYFIRVLLLDEGGYVFHKCNPIINGDWKLESSTEEEYGRSNDEVHMYICCQSVHEISLAGS